MAIPLLEYIVENIQTSQKLGTDLEYIKLNLIKMYKINVKIINVLVSVHFYFNPINIYTYISVIKE